MSGAVSPLGGSSITRPVAQPFDVVEVTAGFQHTCVRTSRGLVRCWGDNSRGQAGSPFPAPRITEVANLTNVAGLSAGYQHTCARLTDGTVRCWGDNANGQSAPSGYRVIF
ncbi:MAG: hypothetical protein IPF99_22625 [Deltaproteobacteria bacterium]|nr:hypothetical protein [Deltaproteobacteria bacterium]